MPDRPIPTRLAGIWLGMALALTPGPILAADYLRLEGHGGPVFSVAVHPQSGEVFTASFDNSIGRWNGATGASRGWLEGHDAAVKAVAVIGADRIVTGGDDFWVIVWDLHTGEPVVKFAEHHGNVVAVAGAPTRNLAASGAWDGTVKVWDLAAHVQLCEFDVGSPVNDVEFIAGGSMLLSASRDGSIRQWSVARQALVREVVGNGFGITRILADESANWLLYGGANGTAQAVTLDGGEPVADLTIGDAPILALARSADGALVAIGDGAGYIHVVDTDGWSAKRSFRANAEGPIWSLAFMPDGERLIAGSPQNHVDLWPVHTAVPVARADGGVTGGEHAKSNGQVQFERRCAVCHTLRGEPVRRAGPTLYGVFGRRVGGLPGYTYSETLDAGTFTWSAETIDQLFDLGPEVFVPGTKMPAQRIVADSDRSDLITYLRQATAVDNNEEQ